LMKPEVYLGGNRDAPEGSGREEPKEASPGKVQCPIGHDFLPPTEAYKGGHVLIGCTRD